MRKLTLTLVCAFGVLAFANTARAQNDDVLDEDHIDDPENGKYVFWDEEEMEAFIDELNAEWEASLEDEALDTCLLLRPEAYYVKTLHNEGTAYAYWDLTTYVTWNSRFTRYEVHAGYTGEDMWEYVDALEVGWRHSASVCPYCDWDDWDAEYSLDGGSTYPDMQDQDCWNTGYPYVVVYYYKGYDSLNFDDEAIYNYFARFNRGGSTTDSPVYLAL
jgi:hypothetical protein